MKSQSFNAGDIWEKYGITEHLGGIPATRRLVERCRITPGQYVLNIGCGTGYTACLLAKRYGAQVVAADSGEHVLETARARIERADLSARVVAVRADVHALDFPSETFDAVIAESLLIFCDKPRAIAEVYRVLKPGGVFGDNELTLLKQPPPSWQTLLSSVTFGLNFQPLLEAAWRAVLEGAGFAEVSAEVSRMHIWTQFTSHMRVDGLPKYFAAVVNGLSDPGVRATFFNRDMLRAWREYPAYVGYGLYAGVKSGEPH